MGVSTVKVMLGFLLGVMAVVLWAVRGDSISPMGGYR